MKSSSPMPIHSTKSERKYNVYLCVLELCGTRNAFNGIRCTIEEAKWKKEITRERIGELYHNILKMAWIHYTTQWMFVEAHTKQYHVSCTPRALHSLSLGGWSYIIRTLSERSEKEKVDVEKRLRAVKRSAAAATEKNCARSTFVHFAVYVHTPKRNWQWRRPNLALYNIRVMCVPLSYCRMCIESIKRKRPL